MKFLWPLGADARRAKEKSRQDAPGGVGICVVASDKSYVRGLSTAFRIGALKRYFGRGTRTALNSVQRNDAEICVYAFTDRDFATPEFFARQTSAIGADRAKLRIFLELVSPVGHGPILAATQKKNAAIAELANANGGYLVPLMSKFLRWGPARMLTKSGAPGTRGYLAIANAVGKLADQYVARTLLRGSEPTTNDGKAIASMPEAGAQAILEQIRWEKVSLPRLLKTPFNAKVIGDFLDDHISFYSYPGWGRIPLVLPIDWSMAGPNRSWRSYFLGLEFVSAVLAYCHASADSRNYRYRDAIEALLQQRGTGPEAILDRAGAVIADFIRNNPPDASSASRAWHEGTVCRRLRALLTYLLCCKQAIDRGIRIDQESVVLAHRSVIDCIELLRGDSVYIKAGNHGVRQDSILIIASLLLSGGEEGKRYLRDGLARLARYQLDHALSPDGVWRENSFGYHCMVMGMLADLATDLRTAGERDMSLLLNAIERMCTFVEAMIKADGSAPLIGDTAPKYYLHTLISARKLLRGFRTDDDDDDEARQAPIDAKSFVRTKDTYFFPDAGYFVSHSSPAMDATGSTIVFYANLYTPKHKHSDDLSVLFTHGATDLLIDGGTYNKEIGDQVRNAARFDPASHNTYRVNGKGYSLRSTRNRRPAGLRTMWQGDGWAAAEGFNTAYPDGSVRRLAIHLKRRQALLVVDRLESKTGAAVNFEQFWHIAPQFVLVSETLDGPLAFASESDGRLLVAFDGEEAALAAEHGGDDNPIAWLMVGDEKTVPTPYLRRAKLLREGTMAAIFQWSEADGKLSVGVQSSARGHLGIDGVGVGFSCRFVLGDDRLECTTLN